MKSLISTKADYHYSFDALRACMMLLGIALHGTISYTTYTHGANWPLHLGESSAATTWPYRDHQTHLVFDYLHNLIHIFRMPLFFVISGLFARHAYLRKGLKEFIENRKKRILYPTLIFWPILFPLVGFGLLPLMPARPLNIEYILSVAGPMHLWFLFYLLYFYAIILLLERNMRVTTWLRQTVLKLTGIAYSPAAILLLALPISLILYYNQGSVLPAGSFGPDIPSVAVYFSFFSFGWFLLERDVLEKTSCLMSVLLLAAGVTLIFLITTYQEVLASRYLFLTVSMASVSVWCFIFSLIAIFSRFAKQRSSVVSYLAARSYWIYLLHFPTVIWLVQLLRSFEWHVFFKAGAVCLTATILVLASFEFFVKESSIGKFLQGK